MSSQSADDTSTGCPVRHQWNPSSGVQITDLREAEEVLRRGRDFVMGGAREESMQLVGGTLIAIDGRPHLNRRKALNRMLRADLPWGAEGNLFLDVFEQRMAALRAEAGVDADHIRFDLNDFSRGLYWRIISAFIGIDNIDTDEDVRQFMELSVPVLHGISVEYSPAEKREPMIQEGVEGARRLREELVQPSYERRLALVREADGDPQKVAQLPGDLLTSLILASSDESEDVELMLREVIEILAGSINNPVAMADYTLDDLMTWLEMHPEDAARVEEKDFLNMAVQESLRLHRTTRQYLVRICVNDSVLETSGREIKAGDWVYIWLAKANRDISVFGEDADSYNPYRVPVDDKFANLGIAFGSGPHTCLGRPMLVWDRGDEETHGFLTKMLQGLYRSGVRPDPQGVQEEEKSPEGGTKFVRYDVVMPR